MFEEIRCVIKGRVQMVMYRDFTQRNAEGLGIVGTAENLNDGSVEVVAQGTPDQLKQLVEKLQEGSILSRVDDVAVEWRSPTAQYEDFSIKYR